MTISVNITVTSKITFERSRDPFRGLVKTGRASAKVNVSSDFIELSQEYDTRAAGNVLDVRLKAIAHMKEQAAAYQQLIANKTAFIETSEVELSSDGLSAAIVLLNSGSDTYKNVRVRIPGEFTPEDAAMVALEKIDELLSFMRDYGV